jgi:adenine-specific DNA methylase
VCSSDLQYILNEVEKLPYLQNGLLKESYDLSVRQMAEKYKHINYGLIHRELEKARKTILKNDIDFGSKLIETFLVDNRLITPSVTEQESVSLLNQFNSIERLAKLGDIKSTKILLEQTQTDVRIFTQERKDKYLNQINNYLTI